MSRYAYLICEEAKEMIFLGKIVIHPDTGETYFHVGPQGAPRNSENTEFTKAILRFFATNMRRTLRVIPEEDLESATDESFVTIGHDAGNGPLMSDYIRDYPG